jgi:outer membrane protein assembly factor BamB
MAPPGLRFSGAFSFVYVVSNDSILHSVTGGDPGGEWPPAFVPYKLGAPAQSRPPVVNFPVGGPNGAAFLGSQDGSLYAIDAVTGSKTWSQSIATMVQAAPAGHFSAYQASAFDLVIVGTRDGSAGNALVARAVSNGDPRWSFTNSAAQGGDDLEIGIISGGAAIDYPANRVYFASRERAGGSSNTLWAVQFTAGTATLLWAQPLGNVDGSPILLNGRVYVGTTNGVVHAVDAVSGVVEWSLPLGDGAVKGFPFPRFGTNQLFLTTTGKIWSIEDNVTSGSVTTGWPIATIPSPSLPLYVPGTLDLFVGSGDGHLYRINVASPSTPSSILLGTGAAAVGAPTLDLLKRMIYVGTDAGVVYGVTYTP